MTAEGGLASVRSSLLIVAQTGDASDLSGPRHTLARLKSQALANGIPLVVELCSACEATLDELPTDHGIPYGKVNAALDIVTRIEAAVWNLSMNSELTDFEGFIDASFDELLPGQVEADRVVFDEQFDIDEETLDVFRLEADELLASIANNLRVLSNSPDDQNALWDIRRNAHTFKGAAGIVGLAEASRIAHRMEDLLDKMVEMRCDAVPQVLDFLNASARRLQALVAAKDMDELEEDLGERFTTAMASVANPMVAGDDLGIKAGESSPEAVLERPGPFKTTSTPIVRVSLDRLDELIKVSRSLTMNRAALAERFLEYQSGINFNNDEFSKIESLFEAQRNLTDDIQAKLLSIRMVKFGTLETRLSRAVNVTCLDEGKKAVVVVENGDVEIDTQVIDSLIEPLLHLLKNAGRARHRTAGYASTASANLREEQSASASRPTMKRWSLSVEDDGAGVSVPKLKEKAIANGIINPVQASSMNDRDAMHLVFDRGLTTTDTINLNAGRGVGMSIVKESVESRGGTVLITSEPQRGTTFTILMPLAAAKPNLVSPEAIEAVEEPVTSLPPLVLVVDDSASVRRQSTKLVEAEGLRVITANNGAEALELLLSGDWEPDLILSDIEMPQIDGWEFLEYVKTDDNFGHVPVVLVTSLEAEIHRQRAFELGASDYLVKPLKEKDLAGFLRLLQNLSPFSS